MNSKKTILLISLVVISVAVFLICMTRGSGGEVSSVDTQNEKRPTFVDGIEIQEDPAMDQYKKEPVVREYVEPAIEGWQTYQNPSKGLVFSYPPGWMIVEREDSDSGDGRLYQSYSGGLSLQNVNNSGTERTVSVSLGPTVSMIGGLAWMMSFEADEGNGYERMQEIVDYYGQGLDGKKITEKTILIDDVEAKHVTVEGYSGTYRIKNENVLFVHDGFIYRAEGNSSVLEGDYSDGSEYQRGSDYVSITDPTTYYFKDFYKTFRLE